MFGTYSDTATRYTCGAVLKTHVQTAREIHDLKTILSHSTMLSKRYARGFNLDSDRFNDSFFVNKIRGTSQ